MSHTADLREILRKMGPGWHNTRQIADASLDYYRDQGLTAMSPMTYTNNILRRLLKMGQVDQFTNESGRHTAYWRLLE